MTKAGILFLTFALALGSCSARKPPAADPLAGVPEEVRADLERKIDIAGMRPIEEEDRPGPVLDHETQEKVLRYRFPGARSIDLVRLMAVPEGREGVCWAEVTKPGEIEARVHVGDDTEEIASGWDDLDAKGWRGLYRSPEGFGFERRAAFASFDLTWRVEVSCHCYVGDRSVVGSRIPVRLRARWQGEGHMPEVAARAGEGEGARVLKPAQTLGSLFAYEYRVEGRYPEDRTGACAGTVSAYLLLDPPML